MQRALATAGAPPQTPAQTQTRLQASDMQQRQQPTIRSAHFRKLFYSVPVDPATPASKVCVFVSDWGRACASANSAPALVPHPQQKFNASGSQRGHCPEGAPIFVLWSMSAASNTFFRSCRTAQDRTAQNSSSVRWHVSGSCRCTPIIGIGNRDSHARITGPSVA